AARGGDRGALDRVLATLYRELHGMARRQLAGQYGQTLDATALVHEAYLKLAGRSGARFDDRAHFFAYAASAMRSVVVDYARQRMARKRGGDLHRVTDLPEDLEGGLRLDDDMLALDVALDQLARVDGKLARVVELRYFGGLAEQETGSPVERGERRSRRDWPRARPSRTAPPRESPPPAGGAGWRCRRAAPAGERGRRTGVGAGGRSTRNRGRGARPSSTASLSIRPAA